MNVTALARKIRITTTELLDILPQLGFDIGKRAIKVDDRTAQKIIAEWPRFKKKLAYIKVQEEKKKEEEEQRLSEGKREVTIPATITVKEFAALAELNVSKVLSELMKNGIFVSMNEKIDADTAMIIGEELYLDVKVSETNEKKDVSETKIKDILANEKKSDLIQRAPVIVVMGHVDHGKTKLLDAIRKTDVVAGESGGITQHIGAYQIDHNNNKITFIDTPGHEVFTAMRSRGAKIADVAILVVAADDGVKPQTVEAYRIIEQSKVPFVVAINKIDKPDADIDRTKSELSNKLKIIPEDWGGKIICQPISALKGDGVDELLDSILLLVEMDQEKIVANPNASAMGTIIESHIDRGEGSVATILIQNGTLRAGDVVLLNEQPLGRVRVMKDYKGELLVEAGPSMPVLITGLKIMPAIGDIIEVSSGDKKVRLNKIRKNTQSNKTQQIAEADSDDVSKVNVIIKSDVLGSAEAIEESLEKLNTKDVKARVVKKGLGAITESDVEQALASGAVVIGFHVTTPQSVQLLARDKGVEIKHYDVVYELVDYIKEKMKAVLGIEISRVDLGTLNVIAMFKTEQKSQIIGCKVEEGIVEINAKVEVLRGEEFITDGKIEMLQAGKQDVKQVETGQECGIQFKGQPLIKIGDTLKVYKEEEIRKTM